MLLNTNEITDRKPSIDKRIRYSVKNVFTARSYAKDLSESKSRQNTSIRTESEKENAIDLDEKIAELKKEIKEK